MKLSNEPAKEDAAVSLFCLLTELEAVHEKLGRILEKYNQTCQYTQQYEEAIREMKETALD